MYGLQINDLSGDIICAGTEEDPCISYFDAVNPTAKSFYIYNYDEVKLDFSPDINRYELYVKYYGKWHYTNFTKETRFGNIPKDRKYSFVFPRYSTKHFKLVGYKNNPTDDIKWGVGTSGAYLDPIWHGVGKTKKPISNNLKVTSKNGWFISEINDTEEFYDIEEISYDGTEFKVILKVNKTLITEKEKEIKENELAPKETEPKEGKLKENLTIEKVYNSIEDIKTEMTVPIKDYNRNKVIYTKDLYTDYNKSTGKKNYTVSMPAKYSILLPDGNITEITRKEVTLKLGENSIYVTATLGTDLKIVQTGLDNTTNYVAGIDVSKGILTSASDSTSYDLTSGLVGYWSFNHGNYTGSWGTEAIDLSGVNNHGTLTNMNIGLDNGTSGWTASGNQSYGMDFDGVDDYVDCGNDVSLNITDVITIEAWVKINGVGISQTIYGKSGSYHLYYYTDISGWRVFFMGLSDNHVQGGSAKLGEWQHIVGVYDGSYIYLYLDGVFIESDPSTGSITKTTNDFNIGSSGFNGTIDEVKIYNRALSADEISALYSLGQPTHSSNTNVDYLSSSAVTYDTIMNSNLSYMVDIPETSHTFTFNPTNIIENQTTVSFNTTDASYFGQETVTITPAYLNEQNLTRIRMSNTYAMNQYDLLNFNLTEYIGWNPDDIINVWYDSYTGNTDNSTLKDTNDWNTWVDTCKSNTNGLVGCWNFEELDGTIAKDRANSSQNNNDGTLTNMNEGVDNSSSGWTRDGKYGNALDFDGTEDSVEVLSGGTVDVSSFTPTWSKNELQGIATDGTYVYISNTTTISKYYTNGTYVTTSNTISDHFGDILYNNSKIYAVVSGCDSGGSSYHSIFEYDTDLTKTNNYDVNDSFSICAGAIGVYDGNFYVAESFFDTRTDRIVKFDSSFNEVSVINTDHQCSFGIQGIEYLTSQNVFQINCHSKEIYRIETDFDNSTIDIDYMGLSDMQGLAYKNSTSIYYADRIGKKVRIIKSDLYLSVFSDDFTVEFWAKPDDYTVAGIYIGNYNDDGLGIFNLETLSGGDLRVCFGAYAATCKDTNYQMNDNWHQIAIVKNESGKTLKVYVNASWVVTYTDDDVQEDYTTKGSLFIGSDARLTTREFAGTIDEVKIYNRALSASEISDEYNLKKDYYNSMPREESGVSAGSNWDVFVTNGTLSRDSDSCYKYNISEGSTATGYNSDGSICTSELPVEITDNNKKVVRIDSNLSYNISEIDITFNISKKNIDRVYTSGETGFWYKIWSDYLNYTS